MKKTLLFLVAVLCLVFALSSCGETPCDHVWKLDGDPAPICAPGATINYKCDLCGATMQTASPSGHALIKTAAKAATCTEAGTVEYYTCGICQKTFSDKDGKTEITSIVEAAKGHTLGALVPAVAADCLNAGAPAYQYCSVCEKYFDEVGDELESIVIDPIAHKFTEIPAKAATCTEAGNIAASYCSACEKLYVGGVAISQEDAVIPATGHKIAAVGKLSPTYLAKGHEAGFMCSGCDTFFTDLAGTAEVAAENMWTPSLGTVRVEAKDFVLDDPSMFVAADEANGILYTALVAGKSSSDAYKPMAKPTSGYVTVTVNVPVSGYYCISLDIKDVRMKWVYVQNNTTASCDSDRYYTQADASTSKTYADYAVHADAVTVKSGICIYCVAGANELVICSNDENNTSTYLGVSALTATLLAGGNDVVDGYIFNKWNFTQNDTRNNDGMKRNQPCKSTTEDGKTQDGSGTYALVKDIGIDYINLEAGKYHAYILDGCTSDIARGAFGNKEYADADGKGYYAHIGLIANTGTYAIANKDIREEDVLAHEIGNPADLYDLYLADEYPHSYGAFAFRDGGIIDVPETAQYKIAMAVYGNAYYINSVIFVPVTEHTLKYVEATSSTLEVQGNIAHYACHCGAKFFDSEGLCPAKDEEIFLPLAGVLANFFVADKCVATDVRIDPDNIGFSAGDYGYAAWEKSTGYNYFAKGELAYTVVPGDNLTTTTEGGILDAAEGKLATVVVLQDPASTENNGCYNGVSVFGGEGGFTEYVTAKFTVDAAGIYEVGGIFSKSYLHWVAVTNTTTGFSASSRLQVFSGDYGRQMTSTTLADYQVPTEGGFASALSNLYFQKGENIVKIAVPKNGNGKHSAALGIASLKATLKVADKDGVFFQKNGGTYRAGAAATNNLNSLGIRALEAGDYRIYALVNCVNLKAEGNDFFALIPEATSLDAAACETYKIAGSVQWTASQALTLDPKGGNAQTYGCAVLQDWGKVTIAAAGNYYFAAATGEQGNVGINGILLVKDDCPAFPYVPAKVSYTLVPGDKLTTTTEGGILDADAGKLATVVVAQDPSKTEGDCGCYNAVSNFGEGAITEYITAKFTVDVAGFYEVSGIFSNSYCHWLAVTNTTTGHSASSRLQVFNGSSQAIMTSKTLADYQVPAEGGFASALSNLYFQEGENVVKIAVPKHASDSNALGVASLTATLKAADESGVFFVKTSGMFRQQDKVNTERNLNSLGVKELAAGTYRVYALVNNSNLKAEGNDFFALIPDGTALDATACATYKIADSVQTTAAQALTLNPTGGNAQTYGCAVFQDWGAVTIAETGSYYFAATVELGEDRNAGIGVNGILLVPVDR